jgi:hypothetical protein
MESIHQNDPQIIRIQGLLDRYLSVREVNRITANTTTVHLDEDSLSSFVEGRISEREASPMVSHLVDCSFCRHVTAELIRLDAEMAGNEIAEPQPAASEPSRVSEVLSGILERMFGTAEPAVFAHGDEDENDKGEKKKDETRED